MKTQILKTGHDEYDLLVDGQVKMQGESFPVVCAVEYSLRHGPMGTDYTEADEVAESIRKGG
ncbi:MAG: hypothetical protein ABIJ57_00115 [Pseudomonadota bacterium]